MAERVNVNEFLFGEEARPSLKQILKEAYRSVRENIQTIKEFKRTGNLSEYYHQLYTNLTAAGAPLRCYPGPVQKILWYCIRNFPSKGFWLVPEIRHHWSSKLKLLKFRKFKKARKTSFLFRKRYSRYRPKFRRNRRYSRFKRYSRRRRSFYPRRRYYRRRY